MATTTKPAKAKEEVEEAPVTPEVAIVPAVVEAPTPSPRTFAKDRLIRDGFFLLGFQPNDVAGALSTVDDELLTLDKARQIVADWRGV